MSNAAIFGTNVFWIDESLPDVVLPIHNEDGPYSEVYHLAQEYLADLGDGRCQTLFVMVEIDQDADKKRKPSTGLTHWDLINKQFARYGYKVKQLFTEYYVPYNVQTGVYSRFL